MTPIFCCGAECGQSGIHFTVNGTGSISTSTKRNGARAFRCNPTAASNTYWNSILLNASNIWVFRVAVFFATALPDANTVILSVNSGNGANGAFFKSSDSKIYPGYYVSPNFTFGSDGVSVTTGTWYYIDVRIDSSANPHKIDVAVSGTTTTQLTRAQATETFTKLNLGNVIGNQNVTMDVFFDDIVISQTSGDYRIGDGFVNHFVPTADGTHNVAGTADFRRGDTTTDILNSTTDAYLLVDDVPMDDTTPDTNDHIRIVAPQNVTDYVECIYGPAPGISTPTVAPRAVEVIAEFFAAGTGLSDEIFKLNDNGTVNTVYDGTQVAGTTTGIYKRKHYATAPTGGAWTVVSGNGNFNNIRFRYGFATDANPDKSLMCTMIEAEFAPVSTTLSVNVFDTGTVTESIGRNEKLMPNKNEAIALLEAVTTNLKHMPSKFEAITVSELVALNAKLQSNVNDLVTLSENLTVYYRHLNVQPVETVSLVEAITARLKDYISTLDNVSITENIQLALITILNLSVSVQDSLSLAEQIKMNLKAMVTVQDAVSVLESITSNLKNMPNVNQGVTVGELVTLNAKLQSNVNDLVALSEAVTAYFRQWNIQPVETVSAIESITLRLQNHINAIDGVLVFESIGMKMTDNINRFESIVLSESVLARLLDSINVSDSITVSEVLALELHFTEIVSAIDNVSVTEFIGASLTNNISVFEQLGHGRKVILVDGRVALKLKEGFYTFV